MAYSLEIFPEAESAMNEAVRQQNKTGKGADLLVAISDALDIIPNIHYWGLTLFVLQMVPFYSLGQNNHLMDSLSSGSYHYSEDFFYATFQINENGTYSYKGRWGLFPAHSSGKWTIKDNNLHLDSDLKDLENLDISVSEQVVDSISGIKVHIQNDDKQILKGIVIFNQNGELECSWEKCYFESNVALKSLQVFYTGGNSKSYLINNSQSNMFYITLPNVPSNLSNYEPMSDIAPIIDKDSFLFRGNKYRISNK